MFSRDSSAPHADARRDCENHRHDDVIVARHLECHGHGGHHRAGAATHHGAHADHGKGRNAEGNRQAEGSEPRREAAAKRGAHEQATAKKCPPMSPTRGWSTSPDALQTTQQPQQPNSWISGRPECSRSSRNRRHRHNTARAPDRGRTSTSRRTACPACGAQYRDGILSNRSSAICRPWIKPAAATPVTAPKTAYSDEQHHRVGIRGQRLQRRNDEMPAAVQRTSAPQMSRRRWQRPPAKRC